MIKYEKSLAFVMKNLVGKKTFFEWCIDIQTLNDKSNTTIIHAFNLKKSY